MSRKGKMVEYRCSGRRRVKPITRGGLILQGPEQIELTGCKHRWLHSILQKAMAKMIRCPKCNSYVVAKTSSA